MIIKDCKDTKQPAPLTLGDLKPGEPFKFKYGLSGIWMRVISGAHAGPSPVTNVSLENGNYGTAYLDTQVVRVNLGVCNKGDL